MALLRTRSGLRAPDRNGRNPDEHGYCKVLQRSKRVRLIQPDGGGKDVFVHATALERAGLRGLVEGQKVGFDTQEDRRTGKIAVGNIGGAV